MKKLFLSLCLAGAMMTPEAFAESFTAGGSTYTYTVKSTQQLNSGVKHTRLRFTSPKTLNVQIVEVNLADPNVRVETTTGTDKLFSAQTLVNRYNALKNAGRKPLVVQNASFWAMSRQADIIDDGKYAANSCLGGLVQNGKLMFETNSATDTWVGERHSVVGFKSNKTGFAGKYKTNMRLMCPAKWGGDENTCILQPTLANKFCHYGTIAVFNQQFPNTREIKVIDSRAGQPGTAMTSSDATFVFLKLRSGQSEAYNTWVEYEVKEVRKNCCSATRGSYDLVVVFAIGPHSAVDCLATNDVMKFKYMWHPSSQTTPASMTAIPGLENMVAGESQPMINGVVQTPSDYGNTTYSRSAYGISQDEKKLIMCVIDKSTDATYGSSSGCNTTVMSYIMQHWGAYNIVNCDAGGSAQMVINGKQVGTPSDSRGIVSSVVVYDAGSANTGGEEQQGETGSDTPTSGGVSAVTPGAGSANPFAYDVTGSFNGTNLTINYKLNAPAKAVTLEINGQTSAGKTVTLSGKTKGTHTKSIDVSDLSPDTYSWSIYVEGNPVSAPIEFMSVPFCHPQGIDIVRNTNDPYYGTLLITEGRPTTSGSYWSGTRGGQGLYLFDPQMNGIPTPGSSTKYAFRGGLADANYNQKVGSAQKSGNTPRKIKIADDGRIFMTTQSSFAAPLYEVPSIAKLLAGQGFTQVMGGPIWTDSNSPNYYCWTDNNGNFSSAPNVGLAVTGSGANLKITLMGGKNAMWSSSTPSATTCHTYNLGQNLLWGGNAPSSTVTGLDGKYLVNYTGANISYDNRGNIWFSQYRGAPKATEPSIVVVSPSGTELLKDITTVIGGGGLAFNNDYTQVMHSSSASTFSVYDLTWDANGKPVRTERYRITHGMGINVNDYAWDLAGNLYACGNSGEKLKGFAMPRENNTVETPARSIYNFTIEAEEAPIQPGYQAGIINCSAQSVSFTCSLGGNDTKDIVVSGTNLQGPITLSLSGTDADLFTLSSTTVGQGQQATITITYRPVESGNDLAMLTLSSSGSQSVSVLLNGTCNKVFGFDDKVKDMTTDWSFCSTLNNASDWANVTKTEQYVRNLKYLNGKLYSANNGNVINIVNPKTGQKTGQLSTTGISGGSVALSGLATIGGHLIASNDARNTETVDAALKVYKWENDANGNPTGNPTLWFTTTSHGIANVGAQMNTTGDLNNGRLWFSDATQVVYFNVSNGNVDATAHVITLEGASSDVTNKSMADVAVLSDGSFWVTGSQSMPKYYNADGSLIGTLKGPIGVSDSMSDKQGTGLEIVEFGDRDYMLLTTYLDNAATISKGAIAVIDITNSMRPGIHTAATTIEGTKVGVYPKAGLGTERNTQFITAVTHSIENDGKELNVYGAVTYQGVIKVSYDGEVEVPLTGIDDITTNTFDEDAEEAIYTIQGIRVESDNLTPGIYVKVKGNKTTKMYVK